MKLSSVHFVVLGVLLLTLNHVQASDPFLGEISMFAGNFAPRGWALCDGQLLAISQNSALFSILGTTYGGDGRTTFGLPDLRGRFAIGAGTGPGLSNRRLGDEYGSSTHTLSVAELPAHQHIGSHTHNASSIELPHTHAVSHTHSFESGMPQHSHDLLGGGNVKRVCFVGDEADQEEGCVQAQGCGDEIQTSIGSFQGTGGEVDSGPPVDGSSGPVPTMGHAPGAIQTSDVSGAAQGGGQSHTNIQPYQAVNYIIALQGVYPSRS
jgi:microcystin-dependent protein